MIRLLLACAGLIAASPPDPAPPPSDDDLKTYQAAAAKARTAEAHMKLALWCEAHGLKGESVRELGQAWLLDPKDAAVRGLMGQVWDGGKFRRPEAIAERVRSDAELAATLAEYERRRKAAAPGSAKAQWELATWCEKNGLKAEMTAHLGAVTRLNPDFEPAWRKLGFKRQRDGRWATAEQIKAREAEARAQEQANRRWGLLLDRWRAWLGTKGRRAAAEAALATLTDPRAVPAILKTFAGKDADAADQLRAVQLLGQVDSAPASRALVSLAVFGKSADVQRSASLTLRRRDTREFVDLLIGMLRKTVGYEIRQVNGQKVLLVEGKEFDVQRLYSTPYLAVTPGIDAFGMPVLYTPYDEQVMGLLLNAGGGGGNAAGAAVSLQATPLPQNVIQNIRGEPGKAGSLLNLALGASPSIALQDALFYQRMIEIRTQLLLEQQRQMTMAVERKFASDVAEIEGFNRATKESNARVAGVLGVVTGLDLGEDQDAWRMWWADQLGYAYEPEKPRVLPKPVLAMEAGAPVPIGAGMSSAILLPPVHTACFAAGTPVRTRSGSRPIEELAVGDQVLTQDATSGVLSYQPVLAIHRNPPSPTLRIALEGQDRPIVATGIHRFWEAGKGWTMARDLRPGAIIRVVGGTARVAAIELDKEPRPVFNLDVARNRDFFAGPGGALVHDNSLPDLRAVPFDAPPALAGGNRPG